jgi:hypothetical protein
MQTRLYRFGQNAKALCRLLDTHPLDQSGNQNRPVRVWKVIDGTLQ